MIYLLFPYSQHLGPRFQFGRIYPYFPSMLVIWKKDGRPYPAGPSIRGAEDRSVCFLDTNAHVSDVTHTD